MCNIAVGSLIKMVNHVKTRHLSQMETLLRMGTDGESFAKALEEMVCLSDVVENDETAKEIYERNSSPENNLSDAGTEQTCSNNHTDDIFNLECNSDSFHNIDVKDIAYSCDFCEYCSYSKKEIKTHMDITHHNKEFSELGDLPKNKARNTIGSCSSHNTELQNPSSDEELTKDKNGNLNIIRSHPETSAQCPLCQEFFCNQATFDSHLQCVHNIDRERLICLIIQLRTLMSTEIGEGLLNESKKKGISTIENQMDVNVSGSLLRPPDVLRCQKCSSIFRQEQQLLLHAQQLKHYPLKDGEYICLASNNTLNGCNLRFSSPISMSTHYHEQHINVIISDRHVYKYRCKQCSLAFKTQEKLSTHLMYHTLRDTTKCRKCAKNFRSITALQSHMKVCHDEDRELLNCENTQYTINKNISETNVSSGNKRIPTDDIPCSSTADFKRLESNSRSGLIVPLPGDMDQRSMKATKDVNNLESLQQIATAAAASGLILNPVEMLNIIQFHHLLSLNVMNLSPPLVLDNPKTSSDERSCNFNIEVKSDSTFENDNISTTPKTSTSLADEGQTNKYKRVIQAPSIPQVYSSHKRARTRITNDQLKILRSHFDINNSPSEETITEMSRESNLPIKVVKHWFRNTLFKERQRNKDSPYNFNNPPSTTLNIEEYEKHVRTKLDFQDDASYNNINISKSPPGSDNVVRKEDISTNDNSSIDPNILLKQPERIDLKIVSDISFERDLSSNAISQAQFESMCSSNNSETFNYDKSESNSSDTLSRSQTPNANVIESSNQQFESSILNQMGPPKIQQTNANTPNNSLDRMSTVDTSVPLLQSNNRFDKLTRSPQYETTSNSTIICNSGGKRANRTRFTDYQIKVLQEFFENNSYPKDSDLEYLSKLLLLSPRVIVVWFQNARQKQRKIYENQPNTTHCDNEDKKQNINYTCKRCHLVFQRYYELIRHQKNHCFKEENNKRSAKAQKAAAQIAQHLSSEDSNSSMDQISNTSSSHLPRMSPKGSSSNSATELSHRSSMDMVSLSTAVSANKSSVAESNEQILVKCSKCNMSFSDKNRLCQHEIMHIRNPNLKSTDKSPLLDINPFCDFLQQLQQNSYMLNENDDESSNKPYVCKRKYSDAISNEYNNFSPSNIHSLSSDHTKVHMPLPYQGIHHQHAEQSILRDTDFLFQYYERNEHVKDAGLEIADKRKPSIEFLLQYYQMMEAHKHLHVEHHQQPIIDQKQTAEDTGSLAVENGKHSPVIEVCRKGSHSVKSTENSHSNYEEDDVRIFRADPVDDTSIKQKSEILEKIDQLDGHNELDAEFYQDRVIPKSEMKAFFSLERSPAELPPFNAKMAANALHFFHQKTYSSNILIKKYNTDILLENHGSMLNKFNAIINKVKNIPVSNYMIEVS